MRKKLLTCDFYTYINDRNDFADVFTAINFFIILNSL